MKRSKTADGIFLLMIIIYIISFFLPVIEFPDKPGWARSGDIMYGFEAWLTGIFCFGLAIPAHFSTISTIIHRLTMNNPQNPQVLFTRINIFFSVIGTIFWPLLTNFNLGAGYFLWMFASIMITIFYQQFRFEKSIEVEETTDQTTE